MPDIHKIVLTGGPCGGKTTALAQLHERLSALGFRVFLVPEVPTIMISAGASFGDMSPDQLIRSEAALLTLQMAMEDAFIRVAETMTQPSVLLFDRGTMDVSAYLPEATWQALLDEQGWTTVGLRDRRYDAVIHLVTAAVGAEAFYTTANNAARRETPGQAAAIDAKLQQAWLGHDRLRVIDNSTDFAGKVRRVLRSVCNAIGAPEPVEIERKFLVAGAPAGAWPVPFEQVEIEQTYLRSSDESSARVRRRSQHGASTYTHTIKRRIGDGQHIEVEHDITGREYVARLADADPSCRTIRKVRRCFVWGHRYFELDRFVEPHTGMLLLEVELESLDEGVELPPFLRIDREVTAESSFMNHALARTI